MASLFNLYDYIIFAFVLFFSLIGLARGFWVQFFSTIVWILGGVIFYVYSPILEQVILAKYMSTPIAHWFVLAIVVVGCFIINFLIRFLLGSLFKINAFTFFNKMGGLVFGACSSSLVVLLIIYAINNSSLSHDSSDWGKSYVITKVTPILEKFHERVDDSASFAAPAHTAVPQLGNTVEVA